MRAAVLLLDLNHDLVQQHVINSMDGFEEWEMRFQSGKILRKTLRRTLSLRMKTFRERRTLSLNRSALFDRHVRIRGLLLDRIIEILLETVEATTTS
jgi:hypothetical protein